MDLLREAKKEEGRITKEREKESRKYLIQIWENQKKKKKKVDMSIQEKVDQELRRGRKVKGNLRKRTTKSAFWENKEEVRIRKKERKGKERKGKERKRKRKKEKKRGGANT